jgi:hypothetical protein
MLLTSSWRAHNSSIDNDEILNLLNFMASPQLFLAIIYALITLISNPDFRKITTFD